MESLIEAIRTAAGTNATDEARAAGVQACRTILAALNAQPGQQLATVPEASAPIALAISAFRGLPPEQLLDLAIARLKAALPDDAHVPVRSLKFHIVQAPPTRGGS